MKKYTIIPVTLLALALIAGCKKNSNENGPIVFNEEFIKVYSLRDMDWKFVTNNSASVAAEWTQGDTDSKTYLGFPAYSYTSSGDEYAFINGSYSYVTGPAEISSWMITPSMMLKDGDIIRFYTRSSNEPGSIDRLQLLMNETGDSYDVGNTPETVGGFTKLLLDINGDRAPDAFPADWNQCSATISGLSSPIRTRLAFRYVVNGATASGIGVDAFTITSK